VARNKIADALRGQRGGTPVSLDVEEGERALEQAASHELISPGVRLDLGYALELLRASKPPCVELLWDYYVLGLDYDEMAALYQLTVDAVRMQIRRCLELAQTLVSQAH
jgi:DNA-directed RNA polymerase specialized sigma24 family protein